MDKLKKMFFENMDACDEYCRQNDLKMIDNLLISIQNLPPEQKFDSMVIAYMTIYDKFRDTLLVLSSLFDQLQKYEQKYGPLGFYNPIIDTIIINQTKNDLNQKDAPTKKQRRRKIKTSYQKLKHRDEPKIKPKQLNQSQNESPEQKIDPKRNFVNIMQNLYEESKANHEKLTKLLKLTKECDYLRIDDLKNVSIEIIDIPQLKVPTMEDLINELSQKPELAEVNLPGTSVENAEKKDVEPKKEKKKKNKKNKKRENEQYELVYPINRNNHNDVNNRNDGQDDDSDKKKKLTSKERYESRKRLFTPTNKFH